jgi:2-hydroxychromene-2-carboxylate isomerase
MGPEATGGVFFYDFGSPDCYLAAESIVVEHGSLVEWLPVVADRIPGCAAVGAFRCAEEELIYREAFETRARAASLQAVRWPHSWPFDSELCALAGHYTHAIGRSIAFSLAAFRQAFAGARDLSQLDSILIAAASNEMHPNAVTKGVELNATRRSLDAACERAASLGVTELPALVTEVPA